MPHDGAAATPQVSVIIPAYNAAGTIRATLRSLDAQEYRDFETIVVDDGSQDDTVSLIRNEFPDVIVITQRNAGPAAARNRGAAAAQGTWLAFLDADDQFLPWRLSWQMDQARRNPQIDAWCGLPIDVDDPLPDAPAILRTGLRISCYTLRDFAVRNPVCMCSSLVKASLFREVGGFDEQFRRAEDYLLWIRVAAAGTIARIEAPLCRYFEGTGTLSMDDRKFLPEVLQAIARAYGPGGALRGIGRAAMARAYQYFSCSWMAYRRGDARSARALLFRSFLAWPFSLSLSDKPAGVRLRRLYRYLRYDPT